MPAALKGLGLWARQQGLATGRLPTTREGRRVDIRRGAGPPGSLNRVARLTARFPGLALDGDVTWNGRINLRGPARLTRAGAVSGCVNVRSMPPTGRGAEQSCL